MIHINIFVHYTSTYPKISNLSWIPNFLDHFFPFVLPCPWTPASLVAFNVCDQCFRSCQTCDQCFRSCQTCDQCFRSCQTWCVPIFFFKTLIVRKLCSSPAALPLQARLANKRKKGMYTQRQRKKGTYTQRNQYEFVLNAILHHREGCVSGGYQLQGKRPHLKQFQICTICILHFIWSSEG